MNEKRPKLRLIIYSLDQLLIIAIISGIISYLSTQKISYEVPLVHEFIQFFSLGMIVLVCAVGFIVNSVFIIKLSVGLMHHKDVKSLNPLMSYAFQFIIIFGIIFISLMVIGGSFGTHTSEYNNFKLSSNTRFEELDELGNELVINFDNQKNPFGTVIGLSEKSFIEKGEDEDDIDYKFCYMKSSLSFIYDRFEKYIYDESNTAIKVIHEDKYDLYIENDGDYFNCYTLLIEDGTEYYISEFWRRGSELTRSDYTVDEFIEDSLYNYKEASK